MKKITLIVIIFFAAITAFCFFNRSSKAEGCSGRCTGSSSCSVCKNCSRCAHCNNGGSCGVCSGGNSYESTTNSGYSNASSSSSSSSSSFSPSSSSPSSSSSSSSSNVHTSKKTATVAKSIVKIYYVRSSVLNIRKEPTKNSEIVCTVKKKGKIKIIKEYDSFWYSVQTLCNGKKVHGYVTKGSIINL